MVKIKLPPPTKLSSEMFRILEAGGNLLWTMCQRCEDNKALVRQGDKGFVCPECGFPFESDPE